MNITATVPAPAGLPAVDDPDFQAQATEVEAGLEVRLVGTADLNVRKQLDLFLATVHALATERALRAVIVDMRSLEFMNSSCLKSMVHWISSINEAPADRQYRIVFLAKAGSRWQRRSLYALSCVAAQLVSVQD